MREIQFKYFQVHIDNEIARGIHTHTQAQI